MYYIIRTARFKKDYKKLSFDIQNRTDQKVKLLIQNPSHPSLRVKRVQKYKNIFECSITKKYRFLFLFDVDKCILIRTGSHDILDKL